MIGLIDQSMRAYEREYKEIELNMIDEILDLVAYIERTLS